MKYLKNTLLLVIFLGAGYFLYSKYFVRGAAQDILLSEEFEENKKKPLDPGGIVISNSSSLIYEKLSPGSVTQASVNLLPDPEEPIKLDFKAAPPMVAEGEESNDYDSIDDILAKLELPVSKEVVLDDNGLMSSPSDAPEESDKITSLAEDSRSVAETPETESREDDSVAGALKITNLPGNNKIYNLNVSPTDSGYKIQLSSAWSKSDAKNEWERIKARHIKYLKNAEMIIKKVKTNDGKIIYLVMAGNYPVLNQAKLICKKLSQSKQNCIVTK